MCDGCCKMGFSVGSQVNLINSKGETLDTRKCNKVKKDGACIFSDNKLSLTSLDSTYF